LADGIVYIDRVEPGQALGGALDVLDQTLLKSVQA
jgi:hypothetical protein